MHFFSLFLLFFIYLGSWAIKLVSLRAFLLLELPFLLIRGLQLSRFQTANAIVSRVRKTEKRKLFSPFPSFRDLISKNNPLCTKEHTVRSVPFKVSRARDTQTDLDLGKKSDQS